MDSNTQTFADLGVIAPICQALAEAGITVPFPVQSLTLPVTTKGADVIGQAKTGTGKTLGFAIPTLERLVVENNDGTFSPKYTDKVPRALIVLPTRELAKQVAAEFKRLCTYLPLQIAEIYGGIPYDSQISALKAGAQILVGTPGRLIDLHRKKYLPLSKVEVIVLDEADEMLDLGFLPDVETLLSRTAQIRQTMLFSATMPGPVVTMARRYMSQATHIRAGEPSDTHLTTEQVKQFVYRTHNLNKIEMLSRLLQAEDCTLTIVFTPTKRGADRLTQELKDRGFAVRALHGDLPQNVREEALKAFKAGRVNVLVATDVAARGIDIDNVSHVVNYQCPEDSKTYVHRIGRTGRAGSTGVSVTFVDWEDMTRWRVINKELELDFADPVETYHTSENFLTDLHLPSGLKGTLPRHKRQESDKPSQSRSRRGAPRSKAAGAAAEKARGSERQNGSKEASSGRRRVRRRRPQ